MTHAELLEHINKDINEGNFVSAIAGWFPARSLFALRAVVEMHTPIQSYMFDEEACSHCSSGEDRSEILYPCPTIQAIEKELA